MQLSDTLLGKKVLTGDLQEYFHLRFPYGQLTGYSTTSKGHDLWHIQHLPRTTTFVVNLFYCGWSVKYLQSSISSWPSSKYKDRPEEQNETASKTVGFTNLQIKYFLPSYRQCLHMANKSEFVDNR